MPDTKLIKVPNFTGKMSLEQLTGLETLPLKSGHPFADYPSLYRGERDGFRFDYLWHPKPRATRLFVLFSGDAMRNKFDPPVFQRWKWAPYFPGHCLYVSDPALFLHDRLGLAWYAGTESYDPMPAIAETITAVAKQFGIAPDHVWSYGSSGGGFAGLRLLDMLPEAGAISINPQTCVTDYEMNSVDFYLRNCFGGRKRSEARADFPKRLNLLEGAAERFGGRRLVYVQNVLDAHHFDDHYRPFCAAMGILPLECEAPLGNAIKTGGTGSFRAIVFADEGGHRRAESSAAFTRAMQDVHAFE